ncbi:MAG: hypothetical protein JST64_12310, partial [Actinobacteria bacterium]|nr:hypothetical protein [Actinomycetota bacterium]
MALDARPDLQESIGPPDLTVGGAGGGTDRLFRRSAMLAGLLVLGILVL